MFIGVHHICFPKSFCICSKAVNQYVSRYCSSEAQKLSQPSLLLVQVTYNGMVIIREHGTCHSAEISETENK